MACNKCVRDSARWFYCSDKCRLKAEAKREPSFKPCDVCGKYIYSTGIYCSAACRQAAYRRRLDPKCGTYANRIDRAQRAARTKQRCEVVIRCDECGGHVRYSLAETTNRKYCSDACKMRAYRKRKKQEA